MTQSLEDIQKKLKNLGNKEKAKIHQRFLRPGRANMEKGTFL
jgi:hypothetical protein